MTNPFKKLTLFEKILWTSSVAVVIVSTLASPKPDIFSLLASILGVTALIFIARGFAIGQVLVIIFATFYALISYKQAYYGEMITYVCMTLPMAAVSLVSWLKNPYGNTGEVRVSRLNAKTVSLVFLSAAVVTVSFYFILGALGNASLIVSTLSVATSFVAATLTYLRSPFYAIGYAVNDVVLIILWVIASATDPGAWCVVACFAAFLVNDVYGFVSWVRMQKRQNTEKLG